MEVTELPSEPGANGAVAAAEPIAEPTSVRARLQAAAADGSTSWNTLLPKLLSEAKAELSSFAVTPATAFTAALEGLRRQAPATIGVSELGAGIDVAALRLGEGAASMRGRSCPHSHAI